MTDRDTTEFNRLLAEMQSPDLMARLQAIEALGRTGDARAVEPLIALLDDPEWLVCITSVKALGVQGDPRAAAPIAEVANRDDCLGFNRAIEACQVIPDALRQLGEPGFQALLHVLREHVNEEFMGGAVVGTLDKLYDRRALDALVLALNSRVYEVSEAARRGLSHFGDDAMPLFVAALESPNDYARSNARWALYDFGATPLPQLLSLLRTSTQPETRVEVINALASIEDDTVDGVLRAALDDSDASVREATVEALGARGDASMIDPLLDLPRYPHRGTDRIVETLKDFGPDAVAPLLRALRDSSRAVDARLRAMETLCEMEDVDTVPALIETLHDNDERMQSSVAKALGELHDERAVPSLLALLDGESERLRRYAIFALAHMGRQEAFDGLVRLATDPNQIGADLGRDYGARYFALNSLSVHFGERAISVLRKLALGDDARMASAALSALRRQSADGISIVIEAMQTSDRQRRLAVLGALTSGIVGKRNDPALIAHLRTLLGDPDLMMRSQAARVLAEEGDASGASILVEALQSDVPGVDVAAARLLAKQGDARALPTLESALEKLDVVVDEARTASDNGDMAQRQRMMRLYEERDELLSAILSLRRVEYEQSIIDERE